MEIILMSEEINVGIKLGKYSLGWDPIPLRLVLLLFRKTLNFRYSFRNKKQRTKQPAMHKGDVKTFEKNFLLNIPKNIALKTILVW